jgi:alpha-beta hydrolase superfamily lysophospholipase
MTSERSRSGETTAFSTKDGLKLFAVHHPVSHARGRVVILHGFAEHLGRYDRLVAELVDAGFACHLFDLRGHGRSEGRRGHIARFSDYLDDLDFFVRETPQRVSETSDLTDPRVDQALEAPLFVLAHSLGGLIVLNYVLHRPQVFDALAVSSPFLAPAFKLPPLAKEVGAIAAYVMPTFSLKTVIQPDWLSRDASIVTAYKQDPLVSSTVTTGWWQAVREAQAEVLERAREIRTPALFLLGDADRLADWRHSRSVFERLGSVNKRLEIYPGFFHEVLNELGRERVIEDLISWFTSNLHSRFADSR